MSIRYNIQIVEQPEQLKQLFYLFEEVFHETDEAKSNVYNVAKLYDDPSFIAIIAMMENEIIGGLTLYLMTTYSSKDPLAYLYDLAVLPVYQSQEMGKQLINYALTHCKAIGVGELFTQTHMDKRLASFYRDTKPDVEDEALIFTYYLD